MADEASKWPFRWPVVNPGPSWSCPRVSMPDIFSIQWDMPLDTWFYAGHASDAEGNEYSVNLYFARGAPPLDPAGQGVSLGIGIGAAATGDYHMCTAPGTGASEEPGTPAALYVPRATDSSYLVQFSGPDAQGSVTYKGGQPMGVAGATYTASARGTSSAGVTMALELELTDALGTKMEGMSGWVGPTYEIPQPRLSITSGTLTVGETVVEVVSGSLWNDRQTYSSPPPAAGGAALTIVKPAPKPLYTGNWMALLLPDGITADLNVVWPEATEPGTQWIMGRALNPSRPPLSASGNLYFADGVDRYNGGAFLNGMGNSDAEFDYDINIFDPAEPPSSPHWQSPVTKNVYCNKWQIALSSRLAQWKVPPMIYVAALVPGCEYAPPGGKAFWEGAVHLFSDPKCTNRIGEGFVEQMGYN